MVKTSTQANEVKSTFRMNLKLQNISRKEPFQCALFHYSFNTCKANQNDNSTKRYVISINSDGKSSERLKQKIMESQKTKMFKVNWNMINESM